MFVIEGKNGSNFRKEAFLSTLGVNYSTRSRRFVANILGTQMFQRFLEERSENPNDAEVLFFDESIVAKNNRSMKRTITKGGKQVTPFLSDRTWKVSVFCAEI